MMKEGFAERISNYVEQGGILIGTYMTGLADDTDRCRFGAYPGPLRSVFGLWVEETDALYPEESNRVLLKREGKEDKIFKCNFLCDRLRTEGAETLGIYGDDFYAGEPCFTVNKYGKGKAYYLGTKPEDDCLQLIVQQIAKEAGVKSPLEE